MKNFYLLFLLIVTTSVCAQTTLFSDDFETGYTDGTDIGGINNWQTLNLSSTFLAKNDASNGAASSDWYARMQGGTASAYVQRVYSLTAGKKYVFKASVLADAQNSAFKLQILDGDAVVLTQPLSGGSNWQEVTATYTAEDNKNHKFRIKRNWGSSGVSFDNVEIKCTNCDPPTPTSFDGTTWNNGDPIGTTNLDLAVSITSGLVTFTGISSFKSLTINAGASATLQTDNSITTVDGIVLNAGASLIAKGNSTVNGAVTYNRTLDTNNWYLVSSPVKGEKYDDDYVTENGIAIGTGLNRGIATYLTFDDSWSYFQGGGSTIKSFIAGKGYSVKRQTDTGTVPFTGTLNTNDAGITIGLISTGNRFNLLGNPYTSHISSAIFLNSEGAISDKKTLWVWNQATGASGAYEVKTLADDNFILAPGQGFFVQANAAGGTFNFTESNQAGSGGTFQRTVTRPEIYLTISDQTDAREAKIYYIENMTTGFDVGYEGEVFGGTTDSFSIYTQLLTENAGKKYQVQSLPNSDYESMVIPIGVNAAAGKEIAFSADALNLPTDIKVFLEDRLTNTFTRLDETNSEYQVTLTESLNGVGRFYLHTAQSVLSTEDVILNSVRVFKTEASTLKITGLPQGKTSFYLYNILGKQMMTTIFTSNGNKEISISKLSAGIYLAKIQTEKGAISKKIILE